jgi:predicted PurR-regulated permease PerM
VTTEPLPAPPPEPLELGVERAQRAWRRLGLRIRSITPSEVARFALAALALYTLFQLIGGAWSDLLPFQLGLALAYITLPLVNWLARFMPRPLAAICVVILELATVVGLVGVILPPIVDELTRLVTGIPTADEIQDRLGDVRAQLALLPEPTRVFVQTALDQASGNIRAHLLLLVQGAIVVVAAGAIGVLNTLGFILALLGIPTWLVAVLTEHRSGMRFVNSVLPKGAQTDFWAVMRMLDRTFGTYIRGQLLLAVLVGAMVFGGLWGLEQLGIVNVRYRLVLAVIATVMQLIPAVGPILGAAPGVVVGLTTSREAALALLLMYIGIQWIQGSLIAPRIQARGPDMHPAVLVVALVLFSGFGFVWVLLAAPIAIAARDLFRYVYGRVGDPPRPAGLLPGEVLRTPVRVVHR